MEAAVLVEAAAVVALAVHLHLFALAGAVAAPTLLVAGPEALVDLAGLPLAVEAVAGLKSPEQAGAAALAATVTPASHLGKEYDHALRNH